MMSTNPTLLLLFVELGAALFGAMAAYALAGLLPRARVQSGAGVAVGLAVGVAACFAVEFAAGYLVPGRGLSDLEYLLVFAGPVAGGSLAQFGPHTEEEDEAEEATNEEDAEDEAR